MDDHEASLAFSRTLMGQARRGRVTIESEGDSEIVAAMREHTVAMQTGSQVEIDAAREKVEKLIAEARPGAPDFGAGARPMPPQEVGMSTIIRRAGGYAN